MISKREVYSAQCDGCGVFFRPKDYHSDRVFEWGEQDELKRMLIGSGWLICSDGRSYCESCKSAKERQEGVLGSAIVGMEATVIAGRWEIEGLVEGIKVPSGFSADVSPRLTVLVHKVLDLGIEKKKRGC